MSAYASEECPLTPRQITIVRWASNGKTSRDIAEIEGLAQVSIETYMQMAMKITGATNRTALVAMSLRKGWIR